MKEKSCELRINLQEQNEKKHIKKIISVWSIVILLTLLALVGNYLGNGKTNARYVGSVSGSDTARVACFVSDVTALSPAADVMLSPSVSGWVQCYSFSVNNEKNTKVSEVSMDYDLQIDITGPVGVSYRVRSLDGNANACDEAEASGNVISATGGKFSAGVSASHSYVLEANWNGASSSYQNANIPISVNVTANVVQRD